MKGIVHFAVGVTVASCFPEVVRAGANGNPLYFILGGIFGILPDTIDFKFCRFFYRHDIEVTPDPNKPDPQVIADAVALAVNRAYETRKPVKIKLDTIRLGADLWRQYSVKFDVPRQRVVVTCGPAVDTGRLPVLDYPRKKAFSPLLCGVKLDYRATTIVDIFDGPVFDMMPTGDGRVTPRFIPWHRKWSHSFPAGLLLAVITSIIWRPLAGVVALSAHTAHILVDQLGFMGSSLFFPFRTGRIEGLKLTHSDESVPNFVAVWFSCLLVFWNLYRALPWEIHHFNVIKLVLYGAIVPAVIFLAFRRLEKKSEKSFSRSARK